MNARQEDASDSVGNLFGCKTKFVPTGDSVYTYAGVGDARPSSRRVDKAHNSHAKPLPEIPLDRGESGIGPVFTAATNTEPIVP